MVGLADLKKYTDNLKTCRMTVNNKYCYFNISGLTTFEFLDILNYKSWVHKTYQRSVTVRYINLIKKLEKGNASFRTSVGFGPLLLRYLRLKGYQFIDQDIEAYRSRLVVYPDLRVNLYDFQQRMVQDWLNVGGIGVVKSPTGSGKCGRWDTLILTTKGMIKIQDIVKKKEQSTIDDFFKDDRSNNRDNEYVVSISKNLKYKPYKITEKYDIGKEDLIAIKTSLGFKISGTREHPIVVMNNKGRLVFKKLKDITKEDYIAVAYDTQNFNDVLELNYHYRFNKYTSNEWRLENIKFMNEEIARLLGYIIAEANAGISEEKALYFQITNYDKEIQDDITEICNNLGIEVSYKYKDDKNEGDPVGIVINSIMFADFMYYLGYKHLAQNKEVPWSILQANKKCQIEFIRALFDGDGTVYEQESKDIIELGSSSYELCRQVQLMLLNMGIIGRLDRKKGATIRYKDEFKTYEESYRLTFYGAEILKFAEIISFGLTRKREKLDICVEKIKNRGRWSDIVYPHLDGIFKALHYRLKEIGKNGFSKDGKIFNSSYDFIMYNNFHQISSYLNGERLPGRSTLEKLLYIYSPIIDFNNEKNKILRNYGMTEKIDNYSQIYNYIKSLYDNFIFDQVEDINEEKDLVYDITVEDVHSYIGNGIINHNTIVGCSAIKHIGRKTLILVHTSDLLINVWNESLIKTFGPGIMSQVGIVGGGLSDSDRMAMKIGARTNDFEENIKKDIVIATFQTLNNRLDVLTQYKFGLMICDEVHHVPSSMFRKVNSAIRAPYKMGLSATMKRLDGLERDIFGQMGDIQTSVTIRELINKGILAEPRFQSPVIVDQIAIEAIENCGHAGLNFSRFVKKTSASSTKKKDYIINICKNVAARNRKFLLFTDYVHAEDVYVRDMYEEALLAEGIRSSIIDQEMSSEERSAVFGFLETGEISGIVFGKLGSEGVNIPSVDVVIMANAIKCISGDTLISTEKGLVRAEDLNVVKPTVARTMELESKSIINVSINELYNFEDEDTIRIFTNNGYEIEGSLNHLVIKKDRKDNLIFESLSDINIGDEVIICGSNIYGNEIQLEYVTAGNEYKESSYSKNIDNCAMDIRDRINHSKFIDKISGQKCIKIYYEELRDSIGFPKNIPFNRLSDLVEHRFYRRGLARPRKYYDKKTKKDYYIINIIPDVYYGDNKDRINFLRKIDHELAELLGYIVSEGYIDHEYDTMEILNMRNYVVERVKYLFKSIFNYDTKLSILKDRNNINRVRCHSKNILEILDYLDVEHISNDKVVPWCILRSSKEIQISFLRALFTGDGGITERNNIVYGSASKRLCDEIHIMLLNMGIVSKKTYSDKSWNIIISSKEADKFMKDIGFSDNRGFEYNINRHDHKILNLQHYKDGNVVFFDTVVSKKKSKNRLYDMNIDSYHSFIAGGFINHNSPITFCQRVGRVMRKVPGKEFCDVYEILLDVPTEYKWSDFNFAEYKAEGFTKLTYKVE